MLCSGLGNIVLERHLVNQTGMALIKQSTSRGPILRQDIFIQRWHMQGEPNSGYVVSRVGVGVAFIRKGKT